MAVEIELKARLSDIEPVKERLFAIGSYLCSYRKLDTYWFSPMTACPRIRVRRVQGHNADGMAYQSAAVTFKSKAISAGIEINDEREFTVSDAGLFEELLGYLGMHKEMYKEKNGWAWAIPPEAGGRSGIVMEPGILAELSQVMGLGWFLELEILPADSSVQTVEECRWQLLALLAKLEIPAERIESRPYGEMLAEMPMKSPPRSSPRSSPP